MIKPRLFIFILSLYFVYFWQHGHVCWDAHFLVLIIPVGRRSRLNSQTGTWSNYATVALHAFDSDTPAQLVMASWTAEYSDGWIGSIDEMDGWRGVR